MPVKDPEKVADQLFNLVWAHLASYSLCDSRYGSEYRRVRVEWFAAGCPTPVAAFIKARANASWEVKL